MSHEAHGYGESGVPSISPTTVSQHGHYPPPVMHVMPSAPPAPSKDPSSTIMMGVGVVMLIALSVIGVQLGRKDREAHPDRAQAASTTANPTNAGQPAVAPPTAVSALPAAASAKPATPGEPPPVSIELEDSETVPTINANKLPDVAPGAPATADTAIHRNVAVPPNPY